MSRHSVRGLASGWFARVGCYRIDTLESRMLLSIAPAGGPDLSFGQGGQTLFSIPVSRNDFASTVAVTPDGRVLVGGTSTVGVNFDGEPGGYSAGFARFTGDGTPDLRFSGDGKTLVDPGQRIEKEPTAILPTIGGKFLVAFDYYDPVIARIDTDGVIDRSFGADGLVQPVAAFGLTGSKFAALADGGFLVAGDYYPQIFRFNADGRSLGDFGPAGFYTFAVQADGRVLAGNVDGRLTRFLPDGSADRSFAGGQLVSVRIPGVPASETYIDQLLPLADGRSLIVMHASKEGVTGTTVIRRLNRDGTIDSTYGVNGVADTGVREYFQTVYAYETTSPKAVAQSDGAVVALGGIGRGRAAKISLVRLTPAGKRDSAFGVRRASAGLVPADIAAAPGGTTFLAASRTHAQEYPVGTTWNDYVVLRLKANGATDSAFGVNGRAIADFKTDNAGASAVAAAPGGKFVVAGHLGAEYYPDGAFLARLNGDGSLDRTFGVGGIVREAIAGSVTSPSAIVVRPNGKIVVGRAADGPGRDDLDFCLTGYNADGSIDKSFGYGGTVHTDLGTHTNDRLNTLLLQPDGKIVAGGQAGTRLFALVRYTPDGKPDGSFGNFGEVLTGFETNYDVAVSRLVMTPNGKIVAVGVAIMRSEGPDYPIYASDFAIARYLPDGRRDPTFGDGGSVQTLLSEYGREPSRITGAVLRPDGNLIVGSNSYYGPRFGLAGFDAAGRRTSFGDVAMPRWTGLAESFAMAAGADGAIYIGGVFTTVADAAPTGFVVARFSGDDGTFDPTFAQGTIKTLFGPPGEPAKARFAAMISTSGNDLVAVGGVNTINGVQRVVVTRYHTGGTPPPVLPPGVGPATRVPIPPSGEIGNALYEATQVVPLGNCVVYGVQSDDPAVRGVWRSDGTAAGTRRVASVAPSRFVTIGTAVLFFVLDPSSPSYDPTYQLWRTNGTAAGTYRLQTGVALNYSYEPPRYAATEGTLYFTVAGMPDAAPTIWRTDGTRAGTRPVITEFAYNLKVVNSLLFYSTYDSLWASDGTLQGTHQISGYYSGPVYAAAGGRAIFVNYDEAHGYELWRTDGTPAGTKLLKDIQPGEESSTLYFMNQIGGRVFFASGNDDGPQALWVSDGTTAGTRLISKINGRFTNDGPQTAVAGGRMYYLVYEVDPELWVTDGTPAGTHRVRTFFRLAGTDYNDNSPTTFTPLGDRLLFVAGSDDAGRELWVTDGTPAGTHVLRDILPGPGGYPKDWFVATSVVGNGVGSVALFAADDGIRGTELWATDGTSAGTHLVADLRPGPDGSGPWDFAWAGGNAFVTTLDDTHGLSLWSVPLSAIGK